MDDDTRQLVAICSTILGAMLIVGATIIGIVGFAADSDLTDALQECAIVRTYDNYDMKAFTKNASVDECRKQAFEFYAKHSAE